MGKNTSIQILGVEIKHHEALSCWWLASGFYDVGRGKTPMLAYMDLLRRINEDHDFQAEKIIEAQIIEYRAACDSMGGES